MSNEINEDKLVKLEEYEAKILKTLINRRELLAGLNDYTDYDLIRILIKLYKAPVHGKDSRKAIINKARKYLEKDITYNEIWLKETRNKIAKLKKQNG